MTTRLTPRELANALIVARDREARGWYLEHGAKALLDLADRVRDLEAAAQTARGALIEGTREFRLYAAAELDTDRRRPMSRRV